MIGRLKGDSFDNPAVWNQIPNDAPDQSGLFVIHLYTVDTSGSFA